MEPLPVPANEFSLLGNPPMSYRSPFLVFHPCLRCLPLFSLDPTATSPIPPTPILLLAFSAAMNKFDDQFLVPLQSKSSLPANYTDTPLALPPVLPPPTCVRSSIRSLLPLHPTLIITHCAKVQPPTDPGLSIVSHHSISPPQRFTLSQCVRNYHFLFFTRLSLDIFLPLCSLYDLCSPRAKTPRPFRCFPLFAN